MKKTIIILLAICSIALISAKTLDFSPKKSHADVRQINGVYVFFMSEPLTEYDYLGTTKVTFTWDSQTSTRLNAVVNKTKKEYPNAQGIVFREIDFSKADAIIFK